MWNLVTLVVIIIVFVGGCVGDTAVKGYYESEKERHFAEMIGKCVNR